MSVLSRKKTQTLFLFFESIENENFFFRTCSNGNGELALKFNNSTQYRQQLTKVGIVDNKTHIEQYDNLSKFMQK